MATPAASPETLVATSSSHDQDSEIIRLADGRSLVIWTRDPPGLGQTAHGQLFDASGAKIGESFQFGATGDVATIIASATAAPDGGFLLAWNEVASGGYLDVRVARYDAAGAQVGSTQLTLPGQQYAATVDALQGGGFALTYSTNNAARNDSLILQMLDNAGSPVGSPQTIFAGATVNNHDYGAGLGEVVQLANGDILVAFVRSDYARATQTVADDVLVQRLTAQGAKVGEPILIDGYSAASQFARDPAITATSDGGFAVAWVRRSPAGLEAEVRKVFADGTASSVTSYPLDDIGRQGVDVDALPNGGFVLSYATAGGIDIALQAFSAGGAAEGQPFIVNSYRTGQQVGPDATWLSEGVLGVTWNSLGQDGERTAVYLSKVTGLYDAASGQVINSPGPGSTLRGGDGADTLNASQGADVLTGGGGADLFAYAALPWSAGRITDFAVGTDRLDLAAIFRASGYSGADPVADRRVTLDSDGAGGTRVYFDRDAPNGGDWPFLVTTLAGVSPTGLTWGELSGAADEEPEPSEGQVITSPGPGSMLQGGAGDDTLVASQGQDVLTGGAGEDAFVYRSLPWNAGRITDFVLGADRLDLSALFQASGYAGSDPVADGRVRLDSNGAGGTNVYFDRDAPNGGDWPFLITTLENVAANGLTWAALSGGGSVNTQPRAAHDDDTVTLGSSTPATGNVITDAAPGDAGDSDQGADDPGANGPLSVIAVRTTHTADTEPDSAGNFVQIGRFGTLTINVSGAYSYTLTSNPEPGVTDVFGYQVRDADGDIAVASLGIQVVGGTPSGEVLTWDRHGDTLTGGAGADTLNASQGADQLTGGGGADRFAFANPPWTAGVVTDFTPGADKIDISALLNAYAGANPLADGWLRLDPDAGSTRVYVDIDGGGGEWPFLITTLQGVAPSAIGLGDFIF